MAAVAVQIGVAAAGIATPMRVAVAVIAVDDVIVVVVLVVVSIVPTRPLVEEPRVLTSREVAVPFRLHSVQPVKRKQ